MSVISGRGSAPTTGTGEQFLKEETLVYLRRAAAARDVSMEKLGQQIMETTARDRMVDAILDDGVKTPLSQV